ncbi:MAG TPA: beta-L-arabinofuranosidase domain-containing protein, partial [Opitutaceae bacterium]
DPRYLAFGQYIVRAYDEPGGPAIVQALLASKGVNETANGKAYEMLANLMGICDLARVTGDRRLLTAVTYAWTDIVRNRLYITGTSSAFEHFARDHDLPNSVDDQLGETCVTTTWIQLNLKLLQLTGGAAYADEVERSLYNHLSAAQNPRGDDWCYYTALEGTKHYDTGITCCHSSGPRALALAPAAAYLQGEASIYVNTFEPSRVRVKLDAQDVELVQESGFPRTGESVLVVHTPREVRFGLRIRVPDWAVPLRVGGQDFGAGWATLPERLWREGDRIRFSYNLSGHVIRGEYANYSRAAFAWGPFILAADATQNPKSGPLEALQVNANVGPSLASPRGGLEFVARAKGAWGGGEGSVALVPFADAGSSGGQYKVWMRTGD